MTATVLCRNLGNRYNETLVFDMLLSYLIKELKALHLMVKL